jgi:hypothetical protein
MPYERDFIDDLADIWNQYEIRKRRDRIMEVLCAMAFAFSMGLAINWR